MISRRLLAGSLYSRDAAATAGEADLHAHDLVSLVALEVVRLEPFEHLGCATLSLGLAPSVRVVLLPMLALSAGIRHDSGDDAQALYQSEDDPQSLAGVQIAGIYAYDAGWAGVKLLLLSRCSASSRASGKKHRLDELGQGSMAASRMREARYSSSTGTR